MYIKRLIDNGTPSLKRNEILIHVTRVNSETVVLMTKSNVKDK